MLTMTPEKMPGRSITSLLTAPLALSLVAALAAGCSGKDGDDTGAAAGADDTASIADTDTGPPLEEQESLSTFESGQYRSTELLILGTDEGIDLNGDEESDNKLPNVLSTVDLLGLVDADLSLDGVNATLAVALAKGDIIQLIDAGQVGALLTVDLLLGDQDEAGALTVSDQSYEGGEPTSRLQGAFSDETNFSVSSDVIQIPFSFFPDEPPLFIPVAEAILIGTLSADVAEGNLYGAIPVEDMMSQVIEPLVPSGDDYDPDLFFGQERDEFLADIENLANKQLADIELEDGRMAVSAALSFTAGPDSW